jgi:hypothetical protein
MTIDELPGLPVSFGMPVAARALGIGESKAYELARTDRFPCPWRQLGSEWRVTRPDLFRYLGLPPDLTARHVDQVAPTAAVATRDPLLAVYHAAILEAAQVLVDRCGMRP